MSTDAAKQRRMPAAAPPPPPRTLNVRKYANARAAELDSLTSLLSDRLNGDFRSRRHKRRRTTGFDRRKHKRRKPSNSAGPGGDEVVEKEKEKLSRRVRRRLELKRSEEIGFGVTGDGTKRLRTHVWHAKRFTMAKVWGFCLPLGLHGRGRGSRALLKWYKQGAVVHDASYYSTVQLDGPEESLMSILSMLLVPTPTGHSEDSSESIISGYMYGNAMLYEAGLVDCKAICPVTYLWKPCKHQGNSQGIENKDEGVQTGSRAHFRRVWIWMHPSALGKGFDCLKLACQKKMDETGVLVDGVCLDGRLARLEVLGSRACQLLQKILHPLASSLEDSLQSKMGDDKHNCDIQEKSILEKAECLSSSAAVSLTVVDPRSIPDMRSACVTETHLDSNQNFAQDNKNEENPAGNLQFKEELLPTSQNCKDLWDVTDGVCPPVEEKVLCLERHKKSLEFFRVKDTTSAEFAAVGHQFSRSCPVILLRNSDQTGLLNGWTIILPISWVKAFWIPLVSGGAHAIGLREKHWIACDVGLPYFPSDFPDCDAYSCFMASEATKVDEQMECRPPARTPSKVPIPPPWSNIGFAFDKVSGHANVVDNGETSDAPPVYNTSAPTCEVFVARTTRMLKSFLKEVSGDHLLLFPKEQDRRSFSRLMNDEVMIRQASDMATLAKHGRRLCYLRVLLHAFREGVFEEGAVVCAPRFSDVSLWTSRSETEDVNLQVPHAFVDSYFKELSSGNWEFHLPEDPAAKEAYRQPIGFVSTGFVRGSKRPAAVGLCEATLLARLRHEQWSQMRARRRRKEIFVLVRNLRSTAYRLALATIVLEVQEGDVKSL